MIFEQSSLFGNKERTYLQQYVVRRSVVLGHQTSFKKQDKTMRNMTKEVNNQFDALAIVTKSDFIVNSLKEKVL